MRGMRSKWSSRDPGAREKARRLRRRLRDAARSRSSVAE